MFGFDDLVGSLFGGGGVSTPYSDANAPLFNQLQGQALGIGQFFNPQNLINSYNPNKQLEQSAGILSGFNPNSFFQGANGSFGQAGKLFGQASNYANADPFGAQDYFKNVLQPGFTDVTQDPQLQAALGALTNQSQQFLNQNADVVNASAQRAAGGTGAGTAGANQISNLVAQTGQNLSNQQAQLLLGEQARRQGIQQAAAQQGLGFGLKQGEFLGNLASQLGGLGQAQGNLGAQQAGTSIDWAKALQGLGAYNQGNQQQQQLIPFQLQQALAQLLQGQVTNSPGLVGGLGQFIGNLQGGGGQAAAAVMSDRRIKHEVEDGKRQIQEFLNSIEAYMFKYIGSNDKNYGVMAQDLEKTEVGKSLVFEHKNIKMINTALATNVILAAIAEMNERLQKLEAKNG